MGLTFPCVKVGPDDATLLHETIRDSVSMEHVLLHAVSGCCKCFQQCRIALIARTGSTLSVALKISSREGLGAMLHVEKLHRLDRPLFQLHLICAVVVKALGCCAVYRKIRSPAEHSLVEKADLSSIYSAVWLIFGISTPWSCSRASNRKNPKLNVCIK